LGIGIARGQYYWVLDIGYWYWYRSNPKKYPYEVDITPEMAFSWDLETVQYLLLVDFAYILQLK